MPVAPLGDTTSGFETRLVISYCRHEPPVATGLHRGPLDDIVVLGYDHAVGYRLGHLVHVVTYDIVAVIYVMQSGETIRCHEVGHPAVETLLKDDVAAAYYHGRRQRLVERVDLTCRRVEITP